MRGIRMEKGDKALSSNGKPSGRERVLFLDKVLMEGCEEEPRGVEVFNLNLIRDLAALGYSLTVVLDRSWAQCFRRWLGDLRVEVLWVPPGGKVFGPLLMAGGLCRRSFDALLLGNVANRLLPLVAILGWARVASRTVMIAHRTPSRRCLEFHGRSGLRVVAVNERIAGFFRDSGFDDVRVWYGVTDADRFYPEARSMDDRRFVNFCVMGKLENDWKGADTAVAALRKMDASARDRCMLHLAAYETPPEFPGENIRAYPWMPFDSIPALLREMDVMMVPSRDEGGVIRETFCQAMVQGMLTGLPQIVSDQSVLVEKLDEGGGIICRSAEEFAAAMTELAGDAEKRRVMGAEAREVALRRYVWDTQLFAGDYLSKNSSEQVS